jgi:CRP-like cAMP-binding protein
VRVIDHIASIPLFETLSGKQRESLSGIAVHRSYTKGQAIFSEGDRGEGFYIVVSGRVKVFKLSSEGREQILHIFGPGEPFGEVSAFSGLDFPAYADAYDDSSVLYFPRDAFLRVIKNDPSLSLAMLAVLSKRLRVLAALVDNLSLKEVPGRLATYFLQLSARENDAAEVELDMSKGNIASLLGTVPETLSRILNRMSKRGILRSEGQRIIILDRPGLEEIAREGGKLS